MVSSIGGAGLARSLPARVENRSAAQEPAAAASAAPVNDTDSAAASVQSAQSAAAARVGGELDAQFDAARVERAQQEMAPVDEAAGADETGSAATGTDTAATATKAAAPAAGASGSSAGASADYIAEADTNNDRKVSEEERIAYEKKQASEAQGDVGRSRAQEVQQTYLPQDSAGSQLDVEA